MAKTPEKQLSSVPDRNSDKMSSYDWEFPDVLLSMISSLESLNLSSALEASKLYLNHEKGANSQ